MPFFLMAYCVVARDLAAHLAVMAGAFTGFHVSLRMSRGIAGYIGSADIADGDLYRAVDGHALAPRLPVDYPYALGVLDPGLLRLRRDRVVGWCGVSR